MWMNHKTICTLPDQAISSGHLQFLAKLFPKIIFLMRMQIILPNVQAIAPENKKN